MADWVLAVERAYVAAATGAPAAAARGAAPAKELLAIARAAAGAVASRYLAVGTPRTLAIVGGDAVFARASIEAHRTWFAPRELRCTDEEVAGSFFGRTVTLGEALAADIVCIHMPMTLAAAQLRRGTHVNALAAVELDAELRALATVVDEPRGLPALAAGLVDGRQLDELTVFLAGDAAIAAAALATASLPD